MSRFTPKSREAIAAYLFILPTLIGFVIFIAYPLVESLRISFYEYGIWGDTTYIGTENFQRLTDGYAPAPYLPQHRRLYYVRGLSECRRRPAAGGLPQSPYAHAGEQLLSLGLLLPDPGRPHLYFRHLEIPLRRRHGCF